MNRRNMIKASVILAAGATASLIPRHGVAQSENIIAEIVDKRSWLDRQVFSDLRQMSAVLISLRTVYGGPKGYERQGKFVDGVWNAWSRSLGQDVEEGYSLAVEKVEPGLRRSGENIKKQMDELLNENRKEFEDWLEQVGVRREHQLQTDILRGQALFAVTANTIVGQDNKLSFFENFTWIWPFC